MNTIRLAVVYAVAGILCIHFAAAQEHGHHATPLGSVSFQADIQTSAVSAWIARAEDRNDDALKIMRETADREDKTEEHIMMPGRVIPVREMLGELLLELNQPSMALAAFEQSLEGDPNRFRNLYGAARAAELTGDREKAKTYYAQLLAQVDPNAAHRGEIEHAKGFVLKR